MDGRPWLWLIAGPNGAGKTTLARERFSHLTNINADAVAQELSPRLPGKAALSAGKQTLGMIPDALEAGRSFSIETTLAGRTHMRTLCDARARGWRTGLAYIGIGSADAALARVKERYRAGGHDIASADVRRRYVRSLANLASVLSKTNAAVVYDNSDAEGHRRVLDVRDREIIHVDPRPPKWLRDALSGVDLKVGARF